VADKMTLQQMATALRYIASTATGADWDDGRWITVDGLFANDLRDIAQTVMMIDLYGYAAKIRERAQKRPDKMPRPQGPTIKMKNFLRRLETIAHTLDICAAYGVGGDLSRRLAKIAKERKA